MKVKTYNALHLVIKNYWETFWTRKVDKNFHGLLSLSFTVLENIFPQILFTIKIKQCVTRALMVMFNIELLSYLKWIPNNSASYIFWSLHFPPSTRKNGVFYDVTGQTWLKILATTFASLVIHLNVNFCSRTCAAHNWL
jgi:hypothetical protein